MGVWPQGSWRGPDPLNPCWARQKAKNHNRVLSTPTALLVVPAYEDSTGGIGGGP